MRHNRLLSSKRQREISELCRLERLVAAAGIGTAWLGVNAMDRETMVNTVSARTQIFEDTGCCAQVLEDRHVHA